MKQYTVSQLAKLAGISVRSLHHYDKIGLLKPAIRTESGYRRYGEQELLRLQQILLYREWDMPLQEIAAILDDPDFDLLQALESHQQKLKARQKRLDRLHKTLVKTINHIKKQNMLTHEELYEGLPKEQAEAWREEAIDRWPTALKKSEAHLKKMEKADFKQLNADFKALWKRLSSMADQDPTSPEVQELVARHHDFIRHFWGTTSLKDKQAEAYTGLGELYVHDERFTEVEGEPNPAFGRFMRDAMKHFAAGL